MTPLETLRALGPGDEAPEDTKRRVYGGVLLALGAAATTGTFAAAHASVPPAPVIAAAKLSPLAASSKLIALGAGLVLFGGALGATAYRLLGPESVRVVYVERPVPVLVPTAPAVAPAPPPRSEPSPASPSSVASAAKPRSGEPAQGSALARERALLDLARKSAAQGDTSVALQQAEHHRQQFPAGHLAEEREAMAIRALFALGRRDEARQRAQAFRRAYPNSLLSEVVDATTSNP